MEKRNDCRENAQKELFYSNSFSCNSAHFLLHRSGQLAVFLELWISVSSQIHGTLVSRTSYARSDGLHFFFSTRDPSVIRLLFVRANQKTYTLTTFGAFLSSSHSVNQKYLRKGCSLQFCKYEAKVRYRQSEDFTW